MPDEPPIVPDDDNPEWTEVDFARARPIAEFPALAAAFALEPFDAADHITDAEAQAELLADALTSGDAAYIAHAREIIARAQVRQAATPPTDGEALP